MVYVWGLLVLPLLTGLFAWQLRKSALTALVQAAGSLGTLLFAGGLIGEVMDSQVLRGWNDLLYVDSLSAFNIGLISLIGFIASLYSIGYMQHELAEKVISHSQFRGYYLIFHLFIFTMLAVSVVDSLGLLWVGIELTTLVSALLVAFYGSGNALEAAWKYLIMGSVGIAFALMGVIFLYLSGVHTQVAEPLNWTQLMVVARQLNPQWTQIAFIFILIGFGTKTGLAPMHFWLPDAHSQAPAPVSAVLSGVLLNTALYGILRVYSIANQTLDGAAAGYLVFFGLLSVIITVPFIMVQSDVKRMLAYSSVEHMGIIVLSVGIGGSLGLYGAFLHMFNHSLAKSMLFLAAGSINQKYRSKQIERISGLIATMPVTGTVFLIAAFAVAGAPPFSLFISEFTIVLAGFAGDHIGVAVALLLLLALVFAGMMFYVVKMVFGVAPAKLERSEISGYSAAALLIPLILVVAGGLYVPSYLDMALYKISGVLLGVK